MVTTTTTTSATPIHSYLAVIPRGLEDVIVTTLRNEAVMTRRQGRIETTATTTTTTIVDTDGIGGNKVTSNERLLDINIWNQRYDQQMFVRAQDIFKQQQEEKNMRKQQQQQQQQQYHNEGKNMAEKEPDSSTNNDDSRVIVPQSISSTSKRWFPQNHVVGSVEVTPGQHVSLGYSMSTMRMATKTNKEATTTITAATTTTVDDDVDDVDCCSTSSYHWSCVGQLAGTVWIQLDTTDITISHDVIIPSRYIGPLIGLITTQTNNECLSSYQRLRQHTAQDMANEVLKHILNDDVPTSTKDGGDNDDDDDDNVDDNSSRQLVFTQKLHTAIEVWKTCAATTWRDYLSPIEYQQLEERIKHNQLRFRISCIRQEPIVTTTTTTVDTMIEKNTTTTTTAMTASSSVDDAVINPIYNIVTTKGSSSTRSRKRKTKSSLAGTSSASSSSTVGNNNNNGSNDGGGEDVVFSYSRQDLCRTIMDTCGPYLVPDYSSTNDHDGAVAAAAGSSSGDNSDGGESGRWQVNMKEFDVEFVIVVLPPHPSSSSFDAHRGEDDGESAAVNNTTTCCGRVALGISLLPYSYLKSRSFAAGIIPPDVTKPYLGGNILSGIVRLRPTTAHALLALATTPSSASSGMGTDNGRSCSCDVVLDPCAGIGTIPIEADRHFCRGEIIKSKSINHVRESLSPSTSTIIGLGGDLVLNNPPFMDAASALEWGGVNNHNSSLLVAWDAAHLPIRSSCIDAIVSDLPFGQQCLSSNSLNQLLPLVFWECARVLRPTTGRMVLLCGGTPRTVLGCVEQLSGRYWRWPCQRVSPVSIGGLMAWIVRIERNDVPFVDSPTMDGSVRTLHERVLNRVRSLTAKRERVGRQRKSDVSEQSGGKRKRQLHPPALQTPPHA